MDTAVSSAPALICLDWGTTSLRAYVVDGAGRVRDSVDSHMGILQEGALAARLDMVAGALVEEHPTLPVIACGMIGSSRGAAEVPYVDLPADLDSLAAGLEQVRIGTTEVAIIPGLRKRGGSSILPDVIRGEETQLAGLETSGDERLIVLPGTHTKWVRMKGRHVIDFSTTMTGELFGLLIEHSILRPEGHTSGFSSDSFDRGVQVGRDYANRLAHAVFSTRSFQLVGELDERQVPAYLSGVLIGAEVAGMSRGSATTVVICGRSSLTHQYARAFEAVGIRTEIVSDDVTARGMHRIAVAAGMTKGEE